MMLQPMNGMMEVLLENKNAVIYGGGGKVGGTVARTMTATAINITCGRVAD